MQVLLLSGLLYLFGVGLVLWFRPSLMFAENGTWKEFGIGRNSDRYTWLPFWLFAITFALMSYIIVFALTGVERSSGDNIVPMMNNTGSRRLRVAAAAARNRIRAVAEPHELIPGYYMLNTPPVNDNGVPRYVYIGDRLS